MAGENFIEHEHKFLVPRDFDVEGFARRAAALGPLSTARVELRDSYFVIPAAPRHIFRHRIGIDRQELTVKDYDSGNETRLEVNLELSGGDQLTAVSKFLGV